MIQVAPTISALKKKYPGTKITVLIDTGCLGVCDGIAGIDEVIIFDCAHLYYELSKDAGGIARGVAYVQSFVKALQEKQFDYSLNMTASGFSALLLSMLQIEDARGMVADNRATRIIRSPWAQLVAAHSYHSNREYMPFNLVDLFRCSAGVARESKQRAYHVAEESRVFAKRFIGQMFSEREEGPLICIQLGASDAKRRWGSQRFAKTISCILAQVNARIVLVGSKDEQLIAAEVLRECPANSVVSAVGETTIPELAALLEASNLLITGDTGPMHIAAAVGTPVVALFLASAIPWETGPYQEGSIVVVPQISCHPCSPILRCSRPDCHSQISPELVAKLALRRLNTEPLTNIQSPHALVLEAYFDEDGFLDFRPLSEDSAKRLFGIRNAYRKLWKSEFFDKDTPALHRDSGDTKLCALARDGIQGINDLGRATAAESQSAELFDQIQSSLVQIDEAIETFGLQNPIFDPLVRLFIIERENLRGSDLSTLASQMREIYLSLERRAAKFQALLLSDNERPTQLCAY